MTAMPSSPYNQFHPEWRERLQRMMKEQRYNARTLSVAAGLSESTVHEWLNPKKLKTPSFPSIAAVAKALGISLDVLTIDNEHAQASQEKDIAPYAINYAKLAGELRAGNWKESGVYAVEDTVLIPAVSHPDFNGIEQFAWRVNGNSMNRVAPRGSFVIGVSFYDIRHFRRLKSGDIVVCRRMEAGKCEYTLKRAVMVGGAFRLDPESSDEQHQDPIWLSTDEDGEESEVLATHLIIGGFQFYV
jgi:transcriptional regulator with XRE-family HTH domain